MARSKVKCQIKRLSLSEFVPCENNAAGTMVRLGKTVKVCSSHARQMAGQMGKGQDWRKLIKPLTKRK